MDQETFRQGMKVIEKYTFLNHASNGPLHDIVRQELHRVVDSQINGNIEVDWDQIQDGFEVVRKPISNLINCHIGEVALISSTAYGIALILESIDWSISVKSGIVIDDLEFNSNSYPYQQLAKKYNKKLHVISSHDGELYLEDYEKILSSQDIKLVGISHVQFVNGFRTNLRKLKQLCETYGAYLLVDAIQSCGGVQVNAKETDFLAVGAYKWCLGPFGTGFLYINENLQNNLVPIHVSAISNSVSTEFRHKEFKPHKDARKFQSLFNPNHLGMGKSIELLNSIGPAIIEKKIFNLTDYLIQLLNEIPQVKIDSNRTEEHKSGIVRIVSNNQQFNLEHIVNEMLARDKVVVSFRENGIRISPHFYNNFDEIDKFVKVLKSYLI